MCGNSRRLGAIGATLCPVPMVEGSTDAPLAEEVLVGSGLIVLSSLGAPLLGSKDGPWPV